MKKVALSETTREQSLASVTELLPEQLKATEMTSINQEVVTAWMNSEGHCASI